MKLTYVDFIAKFAIPLVTTHHPKENQKIRIIALKNKMLDYNICGLHQKHQCLLESLY
jgi:hypothetical protein